MKKLAEELTGRQKLLTDVLEEGRKIVSRLRSNEAYEELTEKIDRELKEVEEERAQLIRMTMALERIIELYDRCEDTLVREAEGDIVQYAQNLQPVAAEVMLSQDAKNAYDGVLDAGSHS